MPAVLVHGVPDTGRMWGPLRSELARSDVEILALPGFGNTPPAGWTATKEAYAGWLEEQVAGFGEPVDLVAHDWGALLARTRRVTMPRADLVAGLVAGGAPAERAAKQAESVDAEMARCILALYRSAVTVGAEWQPAVDAMPPRPAVVFHGADDIYSGCVIAERLAARLDAPLVVYADCAHWWTWEAAPQVAAALTELWS